MGQENNPEKVAAAISDILTRYKNSPQLFSNIRKQAFQTVKQKFNAVRMRQSYQELMINLSKNRPKSSSPHLAKLLDGSPLRQHKNFIRLLETYCFNPDAGLQQMASADIGQFTRPQQAFLLSLLGANAINSGQLRQAVSLMREARSLWGEEYYINLYSGIAEKSAGNFTEAAACLAKAQRLSPHDIEAPIHLMESYLASGERKQAVEISRQLARLLPEDHPLKPSLKLLQVQASTI
ncbi:MAG: hypothetical protein D6814_01130 [Calditrichaeota bacterium]|nr:MAG: hypothetical protein D6814_01130 [Calditrichota bacterium]